MISRIILASSIVLTLVSPHVLYAQTTAVAELRATINGLLEQVKALQLKLSQTQGGASGEAYTFIRTLGFGAAGEDVKKLQEFLTKDKTLYPEGLTTGYFGLFTEKALQKFQIKHNIVSSGNPKTTGFGLLGPRTRAKLNELVAEGAGSSGIIPPGLSIAPGLKEATTTETTTPKESKPIPLTPTSPKAYIVNELDGTLSVVDVSAETVLQTAKIALGGGTLSGILSVVSSPDKTRLYVTDYRTDEVIVVQTSDMNVRARISVGDGPDRMAMTSDGKKLYVANLLSNTISVVDTSTDTVTQTIPTDIKPIDVTPTPDGTRLYVTHYYERGITLSNLRILIIDTGTDAVVGEVKLPPSTLSQKTVFTPDGKKAYTSIQDSDAVGVIDAVNNTLTQTIYGMHNVNQITVSPDGSSVFVVAATDDVPGTNFPSKIYVINTATDTILRQLSGFNAPRGVAVTRDGTKLYVVDRKEDALKIVDLGTDIIVKTIIVGDAPQTVLIVE